MMTTFSQKTHEMGHTQLQDLSEAEVKAKYEDAFKADPVNGFRFGQHIKNYVFAGELFKQAAQMAPASAFADLQSYGFKLPVDTLCEMRDDAKLSATVREALTYNQAQAVAKAEKDSKAQIAQLEKQAAGGTPEAYKISAIYEQFGKVKRFDLEGHIAAMTASVMKKRAEYQKEQAPHPFLEEVLVIAAATSPKAAEIYRPLWENLPFKEKIEAAMSGRGTANWTAKAMHADKLGEAQAAAAR